MTPRFADDHLTVYVGDCRSIMASLPAEAVHCVVTSPPYWGLRDYGVAGQLGLEPTPEEYVANMVAVFREVRRVLRADGTLWLNLGDSYFTRSVSRDKGNRDTIAAIEGAEMPSWREYAGRGRARYSSGHAVLKDKDLVGVPWRVALALQADGWYLRSEVIWHKASVMPDGARDRPTRDHEQVFLLARSRHYFYDADAVAEPIAASTAADTIDDATRADLGYPGSPSRSGGRLGRKVTRNLRTVWRIPHTPYRGAHTAVFPRGLAERCIKAGCPQDGVVLDPFAGSGTTGLVANALGRRAVLVELNPDYIDQAMLRNAQAPLGLGA